MNKRFEFQLFQYLQQIRREMNLRPLNLGGTANYSGGGGGPPGGFIGTLPQTRVSYDYSEEADNTTPPSGASLLDNLNHIRYRLDGLEAGTTGQIIIEENDIVIGSGITTVNFEGSAEVVLDSSTKVTVTVLGSGGLDTNAIHTNVSNEIHALTEKTSPTRASEVVIESSEAGDNWSKFRVTLANVLSANHSQALFTREGVLTATAGTIKVPNHTGRALTIAGVYLDVTTVPSGSAIIVDINKNGTTIFTNQAHRPQIADGASSGNTIDIDVPTWADNEFLTMDVDQIGSVVAGADLTASIKYN